MSKLQLELEITQASDIMVKRKGRMNAAMSVAKGQSYYVTEPGYQAEVVKYETLKEYVGKTYIVTLKRHLGEGGFSIKPEE